jgi:CBS domain-containing protein
MRCPQCEWENLDGADFCEGCSTSLMDVPPARAGRKSLEERIARAPLSILQPALPVTVNPDDAVGEVIAMLARRNIGCALVVRDDVLVGILTERDALMKIGPTLAEVGNQPVRRFMTPAPETLAFSDTIAFALNRMAVGGYRHVPIERDRKPMGIISARDVLAYLTRQFPELLNE